MSGALHGRRLEGERHHPPHGRVRRVLIMVPVESAGRTRRRRERESVHEHRALSKFSVLGEPSKRMPRAGDGRPFVPIGVDVGRMDHDEAASRQQPEQWAELAGLGDHVAAVGGESALPPDLRRREAPSPLE